MKQTARLNGKLTIQPPSGGCMWSNLDHADETRTLQNEVWPAVRAFLADNFPGVKVEFTFDTADLCSDCGLIWEPLTATQAADPAYRFDEHTTAGEPACCHAALNAFRRQRGIPLPTCQRTHA